MVSFPQVSPPEPCAHLSPPPYAPHTPSIQSSSLQKQNKLIASEHVLSYSLFGSQLWGMGEGQPTTDHEGTEEEYRYSYTVSATSALDGGGWSTPRPGRFTTGKEAFLPFYRRQGGPQSRSERVRKISPPPAFDPRTVQPLASRYAD
jgi:hypothetical protein